MANSFLSSNIEICEKYLPFDYCGIYELYLRLVQPFWIMLNVFLTLWFHCKKISKEDGSFAPFTILISGVFIWITFWIASGIESNEYVAGFCSFWMNMAFLNVTFELFWNLPFWGKYKF